MKSREPLDACKLDLRSMARVAPDASQVTCCSLITVIVAALYWRAALFLRRVRLERLEELDHKRFLRTTENLPPDGEMPFFRPTFR
ncbi:hypothetical protein E2542_SST12158 [Spatholobus suberectus]|nr:hypothetical protein E2542_SST12158 [Spatholobus suberectus]